ncbi:phosphotransferase [Vibrio navarrensis]|uniref:phosphotransferase n=1 Tax=Vibrio navarrensis TaxID=29495 RepID=UPI0013025222|nr:phosphotransferase [Vibrio navarrensis]EJL6568136.1 phosphotransferase [Vibrio navarrensis]
MNTRQKQQTEFEASGDNIEVGTPENCPLDPSVLANITEASDYVTKSIDSGLTAEVYQLTINNKKYTLKKKRASALVSNVDGKFSFLNEVQRRADFYKLKSNHDGHELLTNIVDTVYANYRLGIILSPWIEGEPLETLNKDIFRQILETTSLCEQYGLMEWDLCEGNILINEDDKVFLFDFGYMYPFNPLVDINSNGMSDPIFHSVERFETRFFFGWLLDRDNLSEDEKITLFSDLKSVAIDVFNKKISWLNANNASPEVIQHFQNIVNKWSEALKSSNALKNLYRAESFRSHVLDIEDDLHGKSCTKKTLARIDHVLDSIADHYEFLNSNNCLFYGNTDKSRQDLFETYKNKYKLAHQYLII